MAASSDAWWRQKDNRARLAAILVESVRVEGKPKQQHIAYLGGIDESELDRLDVQIWFWEWLTRQLDRLSNRVFADDRTKIEHAVMQKVPCPTRREYDQWKPRACKY